MSVAGVNHSGVSHLKSLQRYVELLDGLSVALAFRGSRLSESALGRLGHRGSPRPWGDSRRSPQQILHRRPTRFVSPLRLVTPWSQLRHGKMARIVRQGGVVY